MILKSIRLQLLWDVGRERVRCSSSFTQTNYFIYLGSLENDLYAFWEVERKLRRLKIELVESIDSWWWQMTEEFRVRILLWIRVENCLKQINFNKSSNLFVIHNFSQQKFSSRNSFFQIEKKIYLSSMDFELKN